MDEARFWEILGAADLDQASDTACIESLVKGLAGLPPEEIVRFRLRFDEYVGAAYTIDLWGACYLINGGCSDDCFHYFRCWLVGQGRDVYEKAVADPDSLADILHGEWPFGSSLDVAPGRAWAAATGRAEDEFYAELAKLAGSGGGVEEGEDWDFDDNDEMRRHFPRLCIHYLEDSAD